MPAAAVHRLLTPVAVRLRHADAVAFHLFLALRCQQFVQLGGHGPGLDRAAKLTKREHELAECGRVSRILAECRLELADRRIWRTRLEIEPSQGYMCLRKTGLFANCEIQRVAGFTEGGSARRSALPKEHIGEKIIEHRIVRSPTKPFVQQRLRFN